MWSPISPLAQWTPIWHTHCCILNEVSMNRLWSFSVFRHARICALRCLGAKDQQAKHQSQIAHLHHVGQVLRERNHFEPRGPPSSRRTGSIESPYEGIHLKGLSQWVFNWSTQIPIYPCFVILSHYGYSSLAQWNPQMRSPCHCNPGDPPLLATVAQCDHFCSQRPGLGMCWRSFTYRSADADWGIPQNSLLNGENYDRPWNFGRENVDRPLNFEVIIASSF